MTEFGDFLYALRKEKGITQSELADMLGITNKAVSKWETGDAMPETSLLLPISRIFGVTVDELLDGKRKDTTITEQSETQAELNDFDEPFDIQKHLFTRGKFDKNTKSLRELICGAACASVILGGIIVYLIIGALYDLWHPYWIIIPAAALLCGIIGIISDVFNKAKRLRKISRGDNPYTDAACGVLIISCIIIYLFLGACLSLWHPYWLIVVVGACSCGIIGAIGKIFIVKTKHAKNAKTQD